MFDFIIGVSLITASGLLHAAEKRGKTEGLFFKFTSRRIIQGDILLLCLKVGGLQGFILFEGTVLGLLIISVKWYEQGCWN